MKSIEIMHKFFGSGHPSDKCGDCKNLIKDGNYYKCRIYDNTSSEASDLRKKRNACAMFNVPYNGMLHTIKFVMVLRLHPPHIDVFIDGEKHPEILRVSEVPGQCEITKWEEDGYWVFEIKVPEGDFWIEDGNNLVFKSQEKV